VSNLQMSQQRKPKPMATPKPDDKAQSKRFLDTAREIGASEDDTAADELMGKLAKQAPEPRKTDSPKKVGAG
jgi:hypothetical protein